VTSFADCQRMAADTAAALGGVDILVNIAGIVAIGAVEEFGEEQWDRVMAVNAKGPFLYAQACILHMKRDREGAIINTASIAGKTGFGGVSAYTVLRVTPTASAMRFMLQLRIWYPANQ